MKGCKGYRLINEYDPYYIELSNTYSLLAELSANPSQTDTPTSTDSKFRIRAAKQFQKNKNDKLKKYLYTNRKNDDELIDVAITLAADELTLMGKNDITNVRLVTIDADHTATDKTKTTILQRGRNRGHTIRTETRRLLNSITCDSKYVQLRRKPTIATFYDNDYDKKMLTYNYGADRHYLSKIGREKLGLPILRVSAKKVGVVNGGACNDKYITKLPFPKLSNKAAEADTFKELPT